MNAFKIKHRILILAVITNVVIFIVLSLFHLYWAAGGVRWINDVLPTSSNGLRRMNPPTASTIMVAIALLIFAFVTTGNVGLYDKYVKRNYFRYGILAIGLLFLLRAIGDFKFIGFFKTVRATRFALNDTNLFSPLCLFISILCLLIFRLNPPTPSPLSTSTAR